MENSDGKLQIALVDHSATQRLAEHVLLVLMDELGGAMTLTELRRKMRATPDEPLGEEQLTEQLADYVQVRAFPHEQKISLQPEPFRQEATSCHSHTPIISRGSELRLVCPCISVRASVLGNVDKELSELPPTPAYRIFITWTMSNLDIVPVRVILTLSVLAPHPAHRKFSNWPFSDWGIGGLGQVLSC